MLLAVRLFVLATAIGLSACGGGGGDNPASSSSSTQTSSSISPTPSSSVNSSSSVVSSAESSSSVVTSSESSSSSQSSSSSVLTIAVKINGTVNGFDTEGDPAELDANQVTVAVHLLDDQEQILESSYPVTSSYDSIQALRFGAEVSGTAATSIAITISHPGYTSYSRKLDAAAIINLDAKLQAVTPQVVEPDIAMSISGISVDGFNIAVSNDDDAGQSDSMSIQIPASLLPEGTESLAVAVRTFDPNDPDDAEFFPGAYADSDGNQLASVAFNFADINTNAGEPLGVAMQKARQQKIARAGGSQKAIAEEPVVINRQIPSQSCNLLASLGDSTSDLPGFQIPVYTYNPTSGLWDLLGQGTVYNNSGEPIAATQTVFNCDSEDFYLEILVTNAIFLSQWWNLDYPLLFSEPVQYCARIQVNSDQGSPLQGVTGIVIDGDDSLDFGSTFFTTDDEGTALIKVSQTTADTDAEIYFYNTGNLDYFTQNITLSTNCDTPSIQVIELARPNLCEVSGKVQYTDGAAASRQLMYSFGTSATEIFGVDFSTTDAAGNYRLNLPCAGNYDLYPFVLLPSQEEPPAWKHTNIDGVVDADELSDDGKVVVMKTIQIDYPRPIIYGAYNSETNELTLYAVSVFDAFPMSYSAIIANLDGTQTFANFSGTFTREEPNEDNGEGYFYIGQITHSLVLPAQPGYIYGGQIIITDGLGQTWNDIKLAIGDANAEIPEED